MLCAAACSASSAPPTPAATPSDAPSASPTPSASSAAPLTAAQVVAKLKAAGLPVGGMTVYTAATDPDRLLGRPNGYISKAAFVDKEIPAWRSAGQHGVDLGGVVEVFATAADAATRKQYIASVEASAATLGTEYDFLDGTVLLRLSEDLTGGQAQAFSAALG